MIKLDSQQFRAQEDQQKIQVKIQVKTIFNNYSRGLIQTKTTLQLRNNSTIQLHIRHLYDCEFYSIIYMNFRQQIYKFNFAIRSTINILQTIGNEILFLLNYQISKNIKYHLQHQKMSQKIIIQINPKQANNPYSTISTAQYFKVVLQVSRGCIPTQNQLIRFVQSTKLINSTLAYSLIRSSNNQIDGQLNYILNNDSSQSQSRDIENLYTNKNDDFTQMENVHKNHIYQQESCSFEAQENINIESLANNKQFENYTDEKDGQGLNNQIQQKHEQNLTQSVNLQLQRITRISDLKLKKFTPEMIKTKKQIHINPQALQLFQKKLQNRQIKSLRNDPNYSNSIKKLDMKVQEVNNLRYNQSNPQILQNSKISHQNFRIHKKKQLIHAPIIQKKEQISAQQQQEQKIEKGQLNKLGAFKIKRKIISQSLKKVQNPSPQIHKSNVQQQEIIDPQNISLQNKVNKKISTTSQQNAQNHIFKIKKSFNDKRLTSIYKIYSKTNKMHDQQPH